MTQKSYGGPRETGLVPSEDTIWSFVSWWFHACSSGQVELGWMNPEGRGLIHFRRFELEDDGLATFAARINSVPGHSLYIRASTINPLAPRGHSGDVDFTQSPGIWSDLDTPDDYARAGKVQSLIRPNAWIITGKHPHPRAQLFFRTTEPIGDADTVRSLNSRLRGLYGGDAQVVNPSRLMRVPGTIAWPYKPGRIPELTTFHIPADDRPKVHYLGTLQSQLPQAPPEQPESGDGDETFSEKLGVKSARRLIQQIKDGPHWHDPMIRLVAHWVGRTWSDIEILATAEHLTMPGFTISQTVEEMKVAIAGARKRWGVPNLDHVVTEGPSSAFEERVADPWDTLSAPAFPIHALPKVLQDFVESRARIMGADPCAIAWSCLSACSAAIDGSIRLRVKKHDDWSVPPSIWVALVGASSTKKTPIANTSWSPIEQRSAEILRNWQRQYETWKALPKEERNDTPEPPPPTRLISHDSTPESLQGVLSRQDRGIGVFRDELAGFIGSMEKYAGGGRGSAADRAFFLQAYNGGPYVVDRVSRGVVSIDNLLITVIGGIQPERLKQFSDLADDGLWQRFVPIIVSRSDLGTDEPGGTAEEAYRHAVLRLLDVQPRMRMELSDAAHVIRRQLEEELHLLEQQEPLGGKFSSFCGKLIGLFGRLCIVMQLLEPSSIASFIVGEKVAQNARTLIRRCVIPHAAAVYQTMGDGGSQSLETTQSVAGYVLTKKLQRVLASDLTSGVRICRKMDLWEIQKAVSPLVAQGWLSPEKEHGGNKAWLVNPAVHEKFAHRAVQETARRSAAQALTMNQGDADDE